ncbi:Protein ERGIC-53 [Mortierella sp. AD094]|nr:Protein ERGIC-53 [Mortierella sp. AD094]
MKTSILLVAVPVLLASTVMAWGGEGAEEPNFTQSALSSPTEGRRYDYKQSMKKPFLYEGKIPSWSHQGTHDFIRLAPSVPGLKGSVWRSTPNDYKEWEVEFSFRAHGQSYVGGKGLAFWYTQERATGGPVFGNKDKWKGLGLFMGTSDPANNRLNPVIFGFMNDGTQSLPSNPTMGDNFGGCLRDFKNSAGPVVVRVSYVDRTLKISVDTFNKGKKMIPCIEKSDISLPPGYYFGISAEAAETGTADDHDLYSFEVYEVNPPAKKGQHLRPHEAEMIKKGEKAEVDEKDRQVYEEVQKIVIEEEEKMKEEIDGPNTLTAAQVAATVGDTQFRIVESLNTIHKKLESLGAPMQPPASTAQSLVDINEKLGSLVTSLKSMETVVQSMVDHIIQHGGLKGGTDITKILKDELETLNAKMVDMDYRQSHQHLVTHSRLVNSRSWLTYVVFLIIVQAMALSAYSWYKKKLEYNEKKFI